MRWSSSLRARWNAWRTRPAADGDVDAELRFHLDALTRQYQQQGLSAADAARRARQTFGGVDQVKEDVRDTRAGRPLEDLWRDVRFGARILRSSPVFAGVAILSLALGIAGTTTIFSLLNAVLWRTLAVPAPSQLYLVDRSDLPPRTARFSVPFFAEQRDARASQAALAATITYGPPMRLGVSGADGQKATEPGSVELVSGEYFTVLGQQPQAGRLLTSRDNLHVDQHAVAVLSDRYWTSRFNRAPAVIGSTLDINNIPFTIIGVAQPGFSGATLDGRPDVWVPLMMQPSLRYFGNASANSLEELYGPWPASPTVRWVQVLARVPDAANVAAVTGALSAGVRRQFETDNPSASAEERGQIPTVHLSSAAHGLLANRDGLRTQLSVLLGMVALLLLIASTNIASLLLARSTARQRELSVRLSLGAGRFRLIRQLLAESLLLGVIGGGIGLVLAVWGQTVAARLLSAIVPEGVPVTLDWRVIGFASALSILSSILFGLAPALRSTKAAVAGVVKAQSRGVVGLSSRFPATNLLVAAQMALCLLLLIVAGLFARSLQVLTHVETGYDGTHLVTARLDLRSSYEKDALPALYRALQERLERIPGVASASVSMMGPLATSERTTSFAVEGYTPKPLERMTVREEFVSASYFATVGVTLKRGRLFNKDDGWTGAKTVIINEALAKRYFAGRDPIGLHWGRDMTTREDRYEIVGVVSDTKTSNLKGVAPGTVYQPVGDTQEYLNSIELRSSAPNLAIAEGLRRAVTDVAPSASVSNLETLRERIDDTTSGERLVAAATLAFSGIALLLACIGLYGTVSYAVTRRTSEIGVRMALGAARGNVLWLILRQAGALVLIGILVGLPLTLAAAQGLKHLFFGVTPLDLIAHTGAIGTLVIVATLAAYLPARRASRVDPVRALRGE